MMLFSSAWSAVIAALVVECVGHRTPIQVSAVDVALVFDVDHVARAVDVAEDLQDSCPSIRW